MTAEGTTIRPEHARRGGFWRALRLVLTLVVAVLALPYVLTLAYLVVDPPSTLMLADRVAGRAYERRTIPLDSVARVAQRAVIASEDTRFCAHYGVDLRALRQVLLEDDEIARGASTLSMQVAKNLFLWPGRSYIRKALELPLALWIDLVWSKRRLLEVYLNIAEWGPGVYGIEAAARAQFGVSAAALTPGQAALLATSLPAPRQRAAARPSRGHRALALRLERRIERERIDTSCLEG